MAVQGIDLGKSKLGWHDTETGVFKPKKGLNHDIIKEMSWLKGEPKLMLDNRLQSYEHFLKLPMPNWGGHIAQIYFAELVL